MSIIVNGRGIPDKGCMNCHYRTGKYCGIKTENDYVYDNVFTYTRPKDCPITELVCCTHSKATSAKNSAHCGECRGIWLKMKDKTLI